MGMPECHDGTLGEVKPISEHGAQAYRQKFWSELTIEEKVERMREVMKQKDQMISELWRVVEQLKVHTHAHHDGRILYDLGQRGYGMLSGEQWLRQDKKHDEVYF